MLVLKPKGGTWTKERGKEQRHLGKEEESPCSGEKRKGTTGLSVLRDVSH